MVKLDLIKILKEEVRLLKGPPNSVIDFGTSKHEYWHESIECFLILNILFVMSIFLMFH